ncbi:MAG TPA: hypothetical protein VNX46_06345 [Candidatus Acidoferrum sp.]|nr:hypothetical protein [Candidatus Acidoferrum sp.]
MKKTHISLILFSVFLFGCSTTCPKMSSATKPNAAPLSLRSLDRLDQYQISLEIGLRYDAPELYVGSTPHQSNVTISLSDYNRRDTNLSNDSGTANFEQYRAWLKIITASHTPMALYYSSPHQSQIVGSSANYFGLDCRGRDMSLIDDTAAK